MKRLYLFIAIYAGLTITGCSTMNSTGKHPQTVANNDKIIKATTPLPQKLALKNPLTVKFYPKGLSAAHHYKVIAEESVSKYNPVGIKRQEAVIHDTLRKLAASVGGDAVINIQHNGKYVSGTIVSFEDEVG